MEPNQITHWYQDPIIVCTIVITIATVANLFVSAFLWLATSRSTNITQQIFEASHRPFLAITRIDMDVVNQVVEIEITIKNIGSLIAKEVSIETDLSVKGKPTMEEEKGTNERILPPGQELIRVVQVGKTTFENIANTYQVWKMENRLRYKNSTGKGYGCNYFHEFSGTVGSFLETKSEEI
jgi:hypothetical protein